MKAEPILFNTDMVRALLAGRKTVTRRVVKPQSPEFGTVIKRASDMFMWKFEHQDYDIAPPYKPGDILYVRETFRIDYLSNIPGTGRIHYKADDSYSDFSFMPERYEMMRRAQLKPGWRPNENMPREAARIFLRVTDVLVERLQNITELDILEKEGVTVDFPQPKPSYMSLAYTETRLKPAVKKAFAELWNSTIKPADRALYGWQANPWIWAIAFKSISREEVRQYV